MIHTRFPASASPEATAPAAHARPSEGLRRSYSLGSLIAAWREQNRFRTELERKLQGDPHLIDDIGLTRRQVEEELARPFWQVL